MVGRQLTERAGAGKQQRNKDRAGEIAEVAANPEQPGLAPARPPFDGRYRNNLLDHGMSMKVIGDFLGHRDPTSTTIHAEVNLAALREVAALDLEGLV